jgi:uridylate kinase
MPASSKRLLVIKLSGSLFFSPQFEKLMRVLRTTPQKKYSLVLIAGGGKAARRYIKAGTRLNTDQSSLDEIGIALSRLNAEVLRLALGKHAVDFVPRSLSEIADSVRLNGVRIVVCGGLHPGQSTNAVAALVAEKTRASWLVNATDVDRVYDKDPNKFKTAKPLKTVTIRQLERILSHASSQAGEYDLMDPVALKIIARSKIKTSITKCDPSIMKSLLLGRRFPRTDIIF